MNMLMARRVADTLCLSLALSACSNTQENSLLSDQKDDPSSHNIDKTAKVDELYLAVYSASAVVPSGVSKTEISGECYTSTFPAHNIIAVENGSLVDILDINPSTDASTKAATCVNGRFNLAINSDALASGNRQSIRAQTYTPCVGIVRSLPRVPGRGDATALHISQLIIERFQGLLDLIQRPTVKFFSFFDD